MKALDNRKFELRFRVTKEERDYILEKASGSYLSFTEYARRRLLDELDIPKEEKNQAVDSKARFACDHDKELMRLAYSTYMFTRELLLIVHGGEVYQEVVKDVQLRLKEWGYEDE